MKSLSSLKLGLFNGKEDTVRLKTAEKFRQLIKELREKRTAQQDTIDFSGKTAMADANNQTAIFIMNVLKFANYEV